MAKRQPVNPITFDEPCPAPFREPVQYAGMLVWKDGQPQVVATRHFDGFKAATTIKTLMQEVLNLPYAGEHPDYKGLTKGEAMIMAMTDRATEGDLDAVKEILDRVMGRPTQSIQSVKVTGTLEEFLDAMAEKASPSVIIDTPSTPLEGNVEDLF